MNDAEYEAQKDRIRPFWEKWTKMLGLHWWAHLEIEYWRDSMPPLAGDGDTKARPGAALVAKCHSDWRYLTLHVEIDCSITVDRTDDEVESTIVHELCHALINESREMEDWMNHEERVVTQLAQAFVWVRDMTRDENKHELPE